jgi:hypothetical protein
MRITKKMLEEKVAEVSIDNQRLIQDNEILKRELHFMSKLMPNASMIIAMERITDALVHTISNLKRR